MHVIPPSPVFGIKDIKVVRTLLSQDVRIASHGLV